MTADTMSAEAREAVRLRLEQLARAGSGRLTPEAVLEDAKRKDSPLHQHFEWDTKKAAHSWWLQQARDLIRSVRVEVVTENKMVSVVAFVRDPSAASGEQGYVPIARLQNDRDLARTALVAEFTRVGDQLRRARELAAALDAQGDVDDLIDRVTGLRQRFIKPAARQQ